MYSTGSDCSILRLYLDIDEPERIPPHYVMNTFSPIYDQATSWNNFTLNNSVIEIINSNTSNTVIQNHPSDVGLQGHPTLESVKYYLLGIIKPIICSFGILGNLLNILVLSRKKFKRSLDCNMEMSVLCGLIALALSDTLYCVSAMPEAFLNRVVTVFGSINFYMVYQMYGSAMENFFTYTSTWLTVLMATTRYIAICRPLHARYLVETKATIVAITVIVLCCALLNLPAYWKFTYIALECPEENLKLYILDHGYFVKNKIFKTTFTYLWFIIGFFIPMCILIYCNVHLICALRESLRIRQNYSVSNRKAANVGSHITPTLIAVICQFLLLMTPSELLNFYYFTTGHDAAESVSFAIVFTNILQTFNFSLNFLLYFIINIRFRRTVFNMIECSQTKRKTVNRKFSASSVKSNIQMHTLFSSLRSSSLSHNWNTHIPT